MNSRPDRSWRIARFLSPAFETFDKPPLPAGLVLKGTGKAPLPLALCRCPLISCPLGLVEGKDTKPAGVFRRCPPAILAGLSLSRKCRSLRARGLAALAESTEIRRKLSVELERESPIPSENGFPAGWPTSPASTKRVVWPEAGVVKPRENGRAERDGLWVTLTAPERRGEEPPTKLFVSVETFLEGR
jgi:hypothetical protein